MNEKTLAIQTPDGAMETFVVHPDGDGPYPGVILYMDAPGIRNELRDFCRRIAAEGYCVLLPDMYYRLGKLRFNVFDDEGMKRMYAAMNSLSNELVMRDTAAMLEYLNNDPAASGPTGCIGYCMSGQYVVTAMATFPEDFAAGASLYGVRIVTDEDDSPHKIVDRIRGELYLGFAETDEHVPDHVIPTLKDALDEHGTTYRLDIWPGTEHGFCFPKRGPIYHEESAEQVWGIVFDLFKRQLAG